MSKVNTSSSSSSFKSKLEEDQRLVRDNLLAELDKYFLHSNSAILADLDNKYKPHELLILLKPKPNTDIKLTSGILSKYLEATNIKFLNISTDTNVGPSYIMESFNNGELNNLFVQARHHFISLKDQLSIANIVKSSKNLTHFMLINVDIHEDSPIFKAVIGTNTVLSFHFDQSFLTCSLSSVLGVIGPLSFIQYSTTRNAKAFLDSAKKMQTMSEGQIPFAGDFYNTFTEITHTVKIANSIKITGKDYYLLPKQIKEYSKVYEALLSPAISEADPMLKNFPPGIVDLIANYHNPDDTKDFNKDDVGRGADAVIKQYPTVYEALLPPAILEADPILKNFPTGIIDLIATYHNLDDIITPTSNLAPTKGNVIATLRGTDLALMGFPQGILPIIANYYDYFKDTSSALEASNATAFDLNLEIFMLGQVPNELGF